MLCLFCLSSSSWMNKAPASCSSLLLTWIGCIPKGFSLLWPHHSSPSCFLSCWVLGTSSFHESSVIYFVLFLRVSPFSWYFSPFLSLICGGFFNIGYLSRRLISSFVPNTWLTCPGSCGTIVPWASCWSWTSSLYSGKRSSSLSHWLSLLFCSCHPLWASHLLWGIYWPSLAASYVWRTRCPSQKSHLGYSWFASWSGCSRL